MYVEMLIFSKILLTNCKLKYLLFQGSVDAREEDDEDEESEESETEDSSNLPGPSIYDRDELLER